VCSRVLLNGNGEGGLRSCPPHLRCEVERRELKKNMLHERERYVFAGKGSVSLSFSEFLSE